MAGPHTSMATGLNQLLLSEAVIDFLHKNIEAIPEELTRIGSLKLSGLFSGEHNGAMAVRGNIFDRHRRCRHQPPQTGNSQFEGTVTTPELDLNQLTGDDNFGKVVANLSVDGLLRPDGKPDVKVSGTVPQFDYKGYSFSNIDLNGNYSPQGYNGLLQIDDPNIKASVGR